MPRVQELVVEYMRMHGLLNARGLFGEPTPGMQLPAQWQACITGRQDLSLAGERSEQLLPSPVQLADMLAAGCC